MNETHTHTHEMHEWTVKNENVRFGAGEMGQMKWKSASATWHMIRALRVFSEFAVLSSLHTETQKSLYEPMRLNAFYRRRAQYSTSANRFSICRWFWCTMSYVNERFVESMAEIEKRKKRNENRLRNERKTRAQHGQWVGLRCPRALLIWMIECSSTPCIPPPSTPPLLHTVSNAWTSIIFVRTKLMTFTKGAGCIQWAKTIKFTMQFTRSWQRTASMCVWVCVFVDEQWRQNRHCLHLIAADNKCHGHCGYMSICGWSIDWVISLDGLNSFMVLWKWMPLDCHRQSPP